MPKKKGHTIANCPDKNLFLLRYDALRANKEFWEYCERLDKEKKDHEELIKNEQNQEKRNKMEEEQKDPERDILIAWNNFPAWVQTASHLDKCLLFYGNILRPVGYTWTRFITAWSNYNLSYRLFPFQVQELTVGDVVPKGSLAVAFNPSLGRKTLIRMFEKFLSSRHKQSKAAAMAAPFCGYFENTEQRVDLKRKTRYIYVYAVSLHRPKDWKRYILKEKKTRSGHPATIPAETYYREFNGKRESIERALFRDCQLGQNISYWAVRGFFPRVTSPK
jgi:hypothetical protein